VKVKFTLEQATKAQMGVEVQFYSFFNLRTNWVGDQRHAPAALPPGKRPGTHRIGGSVDPRAGLDGCGKFRPPPHWDSITGPSSP